MADATYQDATYHKQGGSAYVIANAGALTVESGGTIDLESGGSVDVASGGSIDIESGGNIDIESGGGIDVASGGDVTLASGSTLTFLAEAFGASRLKYALLSLDTVTPVLISGATQLSFAGSVITPEYGYFMFRAATTHSKTSVQLPSANSGARLVMNFDGYIGDANISVFAQSGGGQTGVSLNGLLGTDLSSFEHSAAGQVEMICEADGLWQIVNEEASITERASA
jgi:hypothetical protein